jgi:RHS repeat-associated protein
VTLTTTYVYAVGGRLSSITYPSGRKVIYGRDAAGHVNRMTLGAQALVSGVSYRAFGDATGWTFGNGAAYARSFDPDGRITELSLPANDNIALRYDKAGRITKITDSALPTKTFGYDALDRLTSYRGGALTQSYGYDANSNRTSATLTNGASSTALTYAISPTSNRLASLSGGGSENFTYDAAGNLLVRTPAYDQFSYGARGRMALFARGALKTTYGVNGLGQRVLKADPANANARTHFVYDEAGHLIGEYGPTGELVQETVWLGDLPVATIRPSGVFYIAPDHLGAPHQITNAGGQVVWLWDHDPFGNGAPAAAAGFTYNLRFPGQYYDAETGLFYNYFRDYDPKLGRYVQSDPIGLAGGINTYAYVGGNPISNFDYFGLKVYVGERPIDPLILRAWFKHTVIYLVPDIPSDFREKDLFKSTYGTFASLSALPNGPKRPGLFGALEKHENNPGDSLCHANNITLVPTPAGMTDSQFIEKLISVSKRYNDNYSYDPVPLLASTLGVYNSNSFTSGVIIAAGGVPPELPLLTPGYQEPIPIPK